MTDPQNSPFCTDLEDQIFDSIRTVKDPEHPQTLEELHVVNRPDVHVIFQSMDQYSSDHVHVLETCRAQIHFTPTVPHCTLASLIGLCIRAKVEDSFPGQLKLDVFVKEGTHDTAEQISKQLNDKERVAAALENPNMRKLIDECVSYS